MASIEFRGWIRDAGRRAGLSGPRAEDLVVAAWEAVVNALQHGRSVPTVVVTVAPRDVSVLVIDRGAGFDASRGRPASTGVGRDAEAALRSERGRGRLMMASAADAVRTWRGPDGHVVEIVVAHDG